LREYEYLFQEWINAWGRANSRQTEGDGYKIEYSKGKDRIEYDAVLSSARTKMIEEQWGRPERPMEEKLKGKSDVHVGNFR
jgi:hypothetical protein